MTNVPAIISSVGVLLLIIFSMIRMLMKKNIPQSEVDAEISLLKLMMSRFTPRRATGAPASSVPWMQAPTAKSQEASSKCVMEQLQDPSTLPV